MLLYDGHRFLQYIEGPEDSINVVYSRILGAHSHCELLELAGAGCPAGSFLLVDAAALDRPADIRSVARGNWAALRGGALRQLVAPHLA